MPYRAAIFLSLFISLPVFAQQAQEFFLSNGLKLIVKPDHRAPIAVFQIWYKVGSVDEPSGQSGISHMLEHLMYKGTKIDPEGHLFKSMNRIGAQGNAFTSRDYSYFFHKLEKSHLAIAFQLEAARMQHLSLNQYLFDLEKQVVKEEKATRRSNDPYIDVYDKLYSLAFPQHGYATPIIGYQHDMEKLSLSQVQSWYQHYYQPGNAVIVVSGDVKPQEVIKLSEQYFGNIPSSKVSRTPHKPLLKQVEKRFVFPNSLPVGMLLIGFKVPVITTAAPVWEAYALEVLAGWLDSGSHSYLSRKLIKEQQLASQVKIGYSLLSRYDNLFMIELLPANGATLDKLEKAINREIQQLKMQLISDRELQIIKNQIISTAVFEQDSQHIQAKIIGQAEAIGLNWREDAKYVEHIQKITAKQIQQVLRKYFVAVKKTTIIQPTENN